MTNIKKFDNPSDFTNYLTQQFPRHDAKRAALYKTVQDIVTNHRHSRVSIWDTNPEAAVKKIQLAKKCTFDEATKKTVTFVHGFDRLVDQVAGSCFSFLQSEVHQSIDAFQARQRGLKAYQIIIPCEISRKSQDPTEEIKPQRAMIGYEMANHSFNQVGIKTYPEVQLFHRCINLETNPDFQIQAKKYNYATKNYFLNVFAPNGTDSERKLPLDLDLESDKEQIVFDQSSHFLYLKTKDKTLFKFYMLVNKNG